MINRSAPSGTIIPTLFYDDVAEAITWLCDVFGFTERLRAGDSHAQLAFGNGGVMLSKSRTEGTTECRPRADYAGIKLLVRVDDVDRHFEHTRQRGARIILPPETHFYGERQYSVEDFAGYRWTFSQAVADVDPSVWAQVKSQSE